MSAAAAAAAAAPPDFTCLSSFGCGSCWLAWPRAPAEPPPSLGSRLVAVDAVRRSRRRDSGARRDADAEARGAHEFEVNRRLPGV